MKEKSLQIYQLSRVIRSLEECVTQFWKTERGTLALKLFNKRPDIGNRLIDEHGRVMASSVFQAVLKEVRESDPVLATVIEPLEKTLECIRQPLHLLCELRRQEAQLVHSQDFTSDAAA